MRRIHGFVLLKETNQGIPKLVVKAFDADSSDLDLFKERPRGLPIGFLHKIGTRIGSVLTDENGAICLTIGIRRSADTLEAHAWLARNGRVLIGAPADDYTPMVDWTSPSASRS